MALSTARSAGSRDQSRWCSSPGRASSRAKSTYTAWRANPRRRGRVRLQGLLRQGQRTSGGTYRGPGMKEGLAHPGRVKAEGFPILTDIHEAWQAEPAAEVAEFSRSPRFSAARRPAAGRRPHRAEWSTSKRGNSSRPRHPPRGREGGFHRQPPGDAHRARLLVRLQQSGGGYARLQIMRDAGWPVVFDATHSVQVPGGAGDASGGQPQFIETLARAAVAAVWTAYLSRSTTSPKRPSPMAPTPCGSACCAVSGGG